MVSKSYLPALGWALVILILTLVPPQTLPKVPDWNVVSVHSLAHLFVFLVWAYLLLYGSAQSAISKSYSRNNFWLTLLLAISYGAIIELLQGFMRLGRQPDVADIVYNSIGALLGILSFYFARALNR